MDRQRIERCLERVTAYRASGQKAKVWAAANGVSVRELASWCAHARRWRASLEGVVLEPATRPAAGAGFVAAGLPSASVAATVRVEVTVGTASVALHWPTSHGRELAAWLRELGR